jgi:DNA-binding FadR family transcriptional regulator
MIVDDLMQRELQPGDVLGSEAQLVAGYRVARGTLREAIRLLQSQGIVVSKRGPGGGLIVGQPTSVEFVRMMRLFLQAKGTTYADIPAARLAIEPLFARLAAESRPERGIAELQAVLYEAEHLPLDDENAQFSCATRFHTIVATMSENPLLDLVGTIIHQTYWVDVFGSAPEDALARSHHAHKVIAKAIVAGQGGRAERLMREHILDLEHSYWKGEESALRVGWR